MESFIEAGRKLTATEVAGRNIIVSKAIDLICFPSFLVAFAISRLVSVSPLPISFHS